MTDLHHAINHILANVMDESELTAYHDDLTQLWQADFNHLLKSYDATTETIGVDGTRTSVTTTAGVGLVATNAQGENSVYLYEPNNKPPRPIDSWESVVILGDNIRDNTKYLVVGIDQAIALYKDRMADGGGACVLAIPQMNGTATKKVLDHAIAEFRPKYVITPADNPYELVADEHSTLVLIAGDLSFMLSDNTTFETVLGADDTTILDPVGWGEILPLSDDPTKSNPYPTQAFLGFAPVVERIAYHAQVPESMAGQMVLSCLSTLIQPFIKAPYGHSHISTSIWTLTQAESGAGKSQCTKYAHQAIRDYNRQAELDYNQAMQEWKTAKSSVEPKQLNEFLTNNPEPTKPVNFIVVHEATREALLDDFVVSGAKNRTVLTDEGAMFFGGHSMKKENLAGTIGNLVFLYESGISSRKLANKRGDKNTTHTHKEMAFDCALTLDISAQPIILRPVLSDETLNEQGFLARFLFSAEPSLRGKRDFASIERLKNNPDQDPVLKAFWGNCRAILDNNRVFFESVNAMKAGYGDDDRYLMPYHDFGVRKLAAEKQQSIENKLGYGGEYERYYPFAERVAGNMHRIATLLAVGMGSSTVQAEHIQAGYDIALHSLNEIIRVTKTTPKGETQAELLLDWLLSKVNDQGMILRTEITQKAPNALRNKETLNNILEHLEQTNHVKTVSIKTQSRGGAKTWIQLNPAIL